MDPAARLRCGWMFMHHSSFFRSGHVPRRRNSVLANNHDNDDDHHDHNNYDNHSRANDDHHDHHYDHHHWQLDLLWQWRVRCIWLLQLHEPWRGLQQQLQ